MFSTESVRPEIQIVQSTYSNICIQSRQITFVCRHNNTSGIPPYQPNGRIFHCTSLSFSYSCFIFPPDFQYDVHGHVQRFGFRSIVFISQPTTIFHTGYTF